MTNPTSGRLTSHTPMAACSIISLDGVEFCCGISLVILGVNDSLRAGLLTRFMKHSEDCVCGVNWSLLLSKKGAAWVGDAVNGDSSALFRASTPIFALRGVKYDGVSKAASLPDAWRGVTYGGVSDAASLLLPGDIT